MIEKILLGLVLGVLKFLTERRDQRHAAQAEVYRETYRLAKKAYEWETHVVHDPDGGADLRVRDGAGAIELQADGSGADRPTPPPRV